MGKGKKNKSYFHRIACTYFFNSLFYKKTKNPLFLWEVYRLCRTEKATIPEWVYKYLDDCAGKILTNNDPGDRAASLCHEALGLKSSGPGTPWKKGRDEMKKWDAYALLKQEEESFPEGSHTEKLEAAIAKLMEKFGSDSEIDMRTLNRWELDMKQTFENKDEIDSIFNEMRVLFPID